MKIKYIHRTLLVTVTLSITALMGPQVVNATTGSITVCKVIADSAGNISTGASQPGVTFSLAFMAPSQFNVNTKVCRDDTYKGSLDDTYVWCPAASVPATATFTTPLTLNTKIPGIPAGPGVGGNNAQCKVYSNLTLPDYYQTKGGPITRGGQYFYKEEVVSKGNWEKPLYNDGYSATISLSNLFPYNPAWFDDTTSNDPPLDQRNNEGAIKLSEIKVDDDQVGTDPTKRTLVLFNQEKATKTATPKPSPSPTKSPTPKPSVTKTPSPSPTPSKSPTPTPSPSPIPTPAAPTKQIGNLEGLPLSMNPSSTLNKGNPYWVKLTVYGNGSTVTLDEKINSSYFTVIPLRYNDPTYGQTLRITKPSAGYESEIQNTSCPDSAPSDGNPDCISSQSASGFKLGLGNLTKTDIRYIYFKVIPSNTTNSTTIDSTSSYATYSNLTSPVPLPPGGPVTIDGGVPFFQVFGGDVWSASPNTNSIVSLLTSSSQFFANTVDSIIFHLAGADFGVGEVSPKQWEASQYPKIDENNYDELYVQYKKNIISQDIKPSTVTTSGYYEQAPIPNGKLVLSGANGWGTPSTPLIIDKKVVIFVDGNLYLDNGVNIQVKKDGKSSLAFIVKGRIGINPTITNLQGVYLADGVIDTACTDQASGSADSACSPGKNDPSVNNQLTLEGIFLSNGGFHLDRTGIPGNAPGEKFIYRPDIVVSSTEILGKEHYTWNENKQ